MNCFASPCTAVYPSPSTAVAVYIQLLWKASRVIPQQLHHSAGEPLWAVQVSSYEQHLSEAQAASFQALQDQLHSFQNEMAAAALLRTQLVDKDRQIDTIRLLTPSAADPDKA